MLIFGHWLTMGEQHDEPSNTPFRISDVYHILVRSVQLPERQFKSLTH